MADNGVQFSVEAAQDVASLFQSFINVEVFLMNYFIRAQKRVEAKGVGIGYLPEVLGMFFIVSKNEYIFSTVIHVFGPCWLLSS
ncbi:hypothetical protein [Marinobacter salicampi]|uniref:hypothetical protein n=1 Tax=Marinobacter salicampi TaxID=435907 RepID=UPI001409CF4B|nr:hypothetical protein [Marinobacter salicampi]